MVNSHGERKSQTLSKRHYGIRKKMELSGHVLFDKQENGIVNLIGNIS